MVITIQKYKKYENKWIAVDEKNQEVLAVSRNIRELQKKIPKGKKDRHAVIKFIYPFNTYLAP